MEYRILLKAGLRRHKGVLIGIFFFMLFAAVALGTVLSVWSNSGVYIEHEISRAGFGELTAWVSGVPDMEELRADMERLSGVRSVEVQELIFSNYTVKGQESDSEGQLFALAPEEERYRFFTDDMSSYRKEIPDIMPGEVFVSTSMASMFGAEPGDEIIFPVARTGRDMAFTIKGFYEDPFMGSSMIGMKGFLICKKDREEILSMLRGAGIDALARDRAMLHIFSEDTNITVSELHSTGQSA